MLWFIDFNKIGNDSWKAPYQEIETTLHAILLSFDLDQYIRKEVHKNMWKKYQEAVQLFYQKRQRPENHRMLIPTLKGIVFGEKPEFFDKTKNFVVSYLEIS